MPDSRGGRGQLCTAIPVGCERTCVLGGRGQTSGLGGETQHNSCLKSNSFINILQSFIHGYVIIYFFHVTLQVSLFHAVMMTTMTNNKQRRGSKNESLYNTVRGRGTVSHLGTWVDL